MNMAMTETTPRISADEGLRDGVWTVRVAGHTTSAPEFTARFRDEPIADISVLATDEGWSVAVPLPQAVLSDGTHTIVLIDGVSPEPLASLTVSAGRALAHDTMAEIALLRSELDLLKRAFRDHCARSDG